METREEKIQEGLKLLNKSGALTAKDITSISITKTGLLSDKQESFFTKDMLEEQREKDLNDIVNRLANVCIVNNRGGYTWFTAKINGLEVFTSCANAL